MYKREWRINIVVVPLLLRYVYSHRPHVHSIRWCTAPCTSNTHRFSTWGRSSIFRPMTCNPSWSIDSARMWQSALHIFNSCYCHSHAFKLVICETSMLPRSTPRRPHPGFIQLCNRLDQYIVSTAPVSSWQWDQSNIFMVGIPRQLDDNHSPSTFFQATETQS